MKSHDKIIPEEESPTEPEYFIEEVTSNEANEQIEAEIDDKDEDLFDKSDDIEVKHENDVPTLDQNFETVVSQATEYFENYGRNEHINSFDREMVEFNEKVDLDFDFEKKFIIEEVVKKPSKKFKCESCDKSFHERFMLVKHYDTVHEDVTIELNIVKR